MTSPDQLNTEYWRASASDQPLAGVHTIGSDLDKFLFPGVQVLDIGCGSGALASTCLERGCDVTGIDISEAAITAAVEHYTNATWLVADVTKPFPFADESFDVILLSFVLVSLIDDVLVNQLVTEIRRVLKTGGVVWSVEALISPDYQEQYEAGKIATHRDQVAVSHYADGTVKRFIRHFTNNELEEIFREYRVINHYDTTKVSPSSGKEVIASVHIFQK